MSPDSYGSPPLGEQLATRKIQQRLFSSTMSRGSSSMLLCYAGGRGVRGHRGLIHLWAESHQEPGWTVRRLVAAGG